MSEALLWLACIALCSLTFRIRGGLTEGARYQLPGQVARLTFAAAAGLAAWTGVPWWLALATVPAWWIASTIPLFEAMDLGGHEGTFWGDFGMLAVRGLLWTTLAALVLWWPHVTLDPAVQVWEQGANHPWVLLLIGPTMPLCYWLGRQSGCRLPGLGRGNFCETGEAIYGAALGIGVLAAVA